MKMNSLSKRLLIFFLSISAASSLLVLVPGAAEELSGGAPKSQYAAASLVHGALALVSLWAYIKHKSWARWAIALYGVWAVAQALWFSEYFNDVAFQVYVGVFFAALLLCLYERTARKPVTSSRDKVSLFKQFTWQGAIILFMPFGEFVALWIMAKDNFYSKDDSSSKPYKAISRNKMYVVVVLLIIRVSATSARLINWGE